MKLVTFQSVRMSYGHVDVLSDVSFKLLSGRKLGLIGSNGSGKTSILRLLTGEEESRGGAITRIAGLRLGYVPQHVEHAPAQVVLDAALGEHVALERALRQQEERLASAPQEEVAAATEAYESAREAFERRGGERARSRALGMLDSLGLAGRSESHTRELSGGEKNVLALVRALLTEPELLLLDEPDNHLDFEGVAWLEGFLRSFKGAVLIVSHNRYLLDRVADGILHLEDGRVRSYPGNYSAYRATVLRDKLAQQADYAANQKRLAQLEDLVKRFEVIARAKPDPAWGKRLRARRSQLERERRQAVEKPAAEQESITFRPRTAASQADIAIQVRGYDRAFDDLRLFDAAELEVACGERAALIGPNGCGKTTFLRDLIEHGAWDHDVLRIGPSMSVGYCAQAQEVLDDNATVLGELRSIGSLSAQDASSILAQFLFTPDDFEKRVRDLSGGERNRLQLAKVLTQKPNFLILDEPTNHLDIAAREAVEDVLSDFAGTILLVSHDRYLLDKIATRVIEVRGEKFESFAGNFSEFWAARQAARRPAPARVVTRRRTREPRVTPASPAPATSSPEAQKLDGVISEAEAERVELERRMAAAFTAGDHREGGRIARQLEQHNARLEGLYARWERELA